MRVLLWPARPARLVLGLVLALGSSLVEARAQDSRALFEAAFGTDTRTLATPIVVPVVIDGIKIGEAEVTIDRTPGDSAVDGAALLAALDPLLIEPVKEALGLANDDGFLTFAEIAETGLTARFDDARLELDMTVPMTAREVFTLKLREPKRPPEGASIHAPATTSAYLNLYGGLLNNHVDDQLEVKLDVAGAAQHAGVALEYEAFFGIVPESAFERGDLRLVHGDPAAMRTVQAGDLVYEIIGQQKRRPLLGVGVSHDGALDPTRVVTPAGRREFTLKRTANVEIYVNGVRTSTLRLPPGPYRLQDLPLSAGTNDVHIIATDDAGRSEAFTFDHYFDHRLLREDESTWGVNLGLIAANGARVNALDGPLGASAFYLHGFSETLSAGVHGQGDATQQVLGVSGAWASEMGTIGFDASASHDDAGVGLALAMDWKYADVRADARSTQRDWRFGIEWRSDGFRSWGSDDADPYTFELFGKVSQRLDEKTYVRASAAYRYAADGDHQLGFGVGWSRRIFDRVTLSVGATLDLVGDTTNAAAIVSLSIPFGDGLHGRTTYNSRRNEVTTSLDKYATDGSWHARIDSRVDDDEHAEDALFEFMGDKWRGDLRHTNAVGDTGEQSSTIANLATALAFADGHVALSRPIAESFAIIVPHETLEGEFVAVNPRSDGWQATSGPGPAVVADLPSYGTKKLVIELPDVGAAVDLGDDRPYVATGFRTGTIVPIGREPMATVRGRLVDEEGGILALKMVRFGEQPSLFTNRDGVFVAGDIGPGTHALVVGDRHYSFSIDTVAPGIIELGDLTPD